MCTHTYTKLYPVMCLSMSPTSHSESHCVAPPHCPDHACSLMHILFPACRAADPSAVVAPTPTRPLLPILYRRAIPAHLFVMFSANEAWVHGEQAPMRPLFHLYKTFPDTLPGCTFCQSRAPRGEQQPRESERERGEEREQAWTQGVASF